MFNHITYLYQPIVSLQELEIERYEALLRGDGIHDTQAFVQHLQAQSKGVELDLYTLDYVLRQWQSLELKVRKPVAVNISPNSLADTHFRENALSLIQRHSNIRLSLELTEETPIPSGPEIPAYLRTIQGMGVTVGLDDFGDGFSLFSQAIELDLDYVKLSHSLIRHIPTSIDICGEIERLTRKAHEHGISLVAEHIDQMAQFHWLRDVGVSHGQGWLFAKAGPVIINLPTAEKRLRERLITQEAF